MSGQPHAPAALPRYPLKQACVGPRAVCSVSVDGDWGVRDFSWQKCELLCAAGRDREIHNTRTPSNLQLTAGRQALCYQALCSTQATAGHCVPSRWTSAKNHQVHVHPHSAF